jgi:hypothetical protein
MHCSKPSYKIVIEGDEFGFTAYDQETKNLILMYQNNAESFDKLITFIYDTINGQTAIREKQH